MGDAVILLYHRIAELSLDPYGLAVGPAEFRTQMAYLARVYRPMRLDDLVWAAREGSLPERAVAVTFDDGYLDNLEVASPILLDLGIPATFFIPSHGLLGREFWWDVLAEVFFGPSPLPDHLEVQWAGEALVLPTMTAEDRYAAHQALYHRIRTADAEARDDVARRVKQWSGITTSNGTTRPMNRTELQELARRPGHSIGGHGTHHISFTAHATEVVRRDVRENKRLLEEITGRDLTCFAYPFGEHDDRSVHLVGDLGYEAAVTCVEDRVRPGMDTLRLPRLEVGRWDVPGFEDRLQTLLLHRDLLEPEPSRGAAPGATLQTSPSSRATLEPEAAGSKPTVCVVIPCYNLGAYLDQAVQSVLDQSYQDFEILIIDDGSTEPATRHLFNSYQRPKTRIFRTENQGLARARNFGLAEARGRYVSFLDADDLLEPDFLARTVERLDADPSLAFVSCWLRAFGDAEFLWQPTDCTFPRLLAEDTVCTAALTRVDAVQAVGGFDAGMPLAGYEDWDLAISLVERGLHGVILPEFLFRYRIRKRSMSADCASPGNHALLMRYLIDKHAGTYREHLPGLLTTVQARTSELEHNVPPIPGDAAPAVGRIEFLENTLRQVLASRAWQVTSPLRSAFGRLQRTRKRRVKPRITVVVAGEGDADALRRTLDSLRFLTAWDGQLILADEGSADPLRRALVQWYADGGLEVVPTEAKGAAAARSAGLQQSRAPILFAMAVGDTVEAAALQRAVTLLESDPHTVFVTCGLHDRSTGFTWLPDSAALPAVLACPRLPFPVVRHEALVRVGGYDPGLPTPGQADWELTIRLAARGSAGTVLREPLVWTHVARDAAAGHSEGAEASFVRPVFDKHRATFESFWMEAILGQESLRRNLQSHLEARHASPPQPPPSQQIDWGGMRRLEPVSAVWGVDRGQPVDRHFIEGFLKQHRADIRGRVLEVKDPVYTDAFGEGVVAKEVVDVATNNPVATIVGDLRDGRTLPSDSFDCFILTQTLHIIYEMAQVIESAAATLRPGGVLLATLPCVSRVDYESGLHGDCWRATPASARRLFEDVFGAGNVEVQAFGNVLLCCGFLMGLAAAEFTPEELDHNDPYFPLIVCVRAVKLQDLPGNSGDG
jgi:glycosyltransferase involved in cell wall biosynthesis/peptidoglycan/xylan/chitin deacetylase (PgdA/CDA1 family)/SAM-dependent methyltransferase